MENDIIEELHVLVHELWKQILNNAFFKHIGRKKIDVKLYQLLMAQVYHYTKHNAASQAVAAFNLHSSASNLQPFVYRHALDEVGHENMVLHDLNSIGILDQALIDQGPLPPTDALIEYLYGASVRHGAIARLGYSFWAEDAYQYIDDSLVGTIRRDLDLADENMTFFVAHSRIDEKHSAQVRAAIRKYCTKPEDRRLIKSVAETTLYLTGCILDEVARECR